MDRAIIKLTLSTALGALYALSTGSVALAQSSFSTPSVPTPTYNPPPVMQPPPTVPQVNFPIFPVIQTMPVRDTLPLIPTDFTRPFMGTPSPLNFPTLQPGNAVKKLSEKDFPSPDDAQSDSGIIVKFIPGSDYTRPSPSTVDLTEGALLISVRKPATLAVISTPHGSVSVATNSDVIVRYQNGVLRVMNLTGLGESVKVKVHSAEVSATVNGKSYSDPVKNFAITLALKVGHELVSADHALTNRDLHPHDGIGRRQFALVEQNVMAVSEFSLESALNGADLLLDLQQATSGVKERRVLNDMAKMASVLNYLHGAGGYTALK